MYLLYIFFKCSDQCPYLTIPSSVICIEPAAFEKCTSLQQIIIPSSVTSIGRFTYKYDNNNLSDYVDLSHSINVDVSVKNWQFLDVWKSVWDSVPSKTQEIKATEYHIANKICLIMDTLKAFL